MIINPSALMLELIASLARRLTALTFILFSSSGGGGGGGRVAVGPVNATVNNIVFIPLMNMCLFSV